MVVMVVMMRTMKNDACGFDGDDHGGGDDGSNDDDNCDGSGDNDEGQ